MFLFSLTVNEKKKEKNEEVHMNNSIGELFLAFF